MATENNDTELIEYFAKYDKGGDSEELCLKRCFFNRPAKVGISYAESYNTYQKLLAQITQCRKEETVALCHAVSDTVPHMPLELCALITEMMYPTEQCKFDTTSRKFIAHTQMHPEVHAAVIKGDLNRFNELAKAGWVTVSQPSLLHTLDSAEWAGACQKSPLYQAFKLAADKDQQTILERLVELTPFVLLEQIKRDFPQLAANKQWSKKTEEWREKKNRDLLNNLHDEDYFLKSFTLILQRGANPDLLHPRTHEPIAVAAAFRSDLYLKTIISYGANLNASIIQKGITKKVPEIIIETVTNEDKALVPLFKALLDAGIDPNSTDSRGNPILWKIIEGVEDDDDDVIDFLKLFLSNEKFNVNAQITDQVNNEAVTKSLVWWLLTYSNYESAILLLKAGANIDDAYDALAHLINVPKKLQRALQHETIKHIILHPKLIAFLQPKANQQPQTAAAPADQKQSTEPTHKME